jgi:two-component system nitrate/nitrite response regulator NarL
MREKRKILSDREHEVLQLIAKGYSSKLMSQELEISEYTVQTHRRNMVRKLKMNKAEMIVWAYREGILK